MSELEDELRDALERLGSEMEAPQRWEAILVQLFDYLGDQGIGSLDALSPKDLVGFLFRHGPNDLLSRNTIGDRGAVAYWLLRYRAPELGFPPAKVESMPGQPVRALTTEEMVKVQRVVRPGVAAARVALAQTAMSTGDVCDVPISALDAPDEPSVVRWPEEDGTTRVYVLTDWGRYVIRDQVRRAGGDPQAYVAYEGMGAPGSAARRAAASKILTHTLEAAGIAQDPAVKPRSISYWGGLVCRERGESPETVARLLGVRTENLPRFLQ